MQRGVTARVAAMVPAGWRDYWTHSRDPLRSLVLVVPLLLSYEVAMAWLRPPVRNGAEHLVAEFVGRVPPHTLAALRGIALAALCACTLTWALSGRRHSVSGLPVLEGLLHAVWLGPLVGLLVQGAFDGLGLSAHLSTWTSHAARPPWLPFLLSVGAGLWEEIVFRFGLLGGLVYVLSRPGLLTTRAATGVALILSALLFSLYHHLGSSGEPFALDRFAFRAVAGTILGLLFILRGLAVVVYMHVFYDLLCDLRALVP